MIPASVVVISRIAFLSTLTQGSSLLSFAAFSSAVVPSNTIPYSSSIAASSSLPSRLLSSSSSSSLFSSSSSNSNNNKNNNMSAVSTIKTPNDLIGKSFDIEYKSEKSNATYRFHVLTDSKLKWELMKGEGNGNGDEEDYVITQITDEGKLLITWIEADGLGLSNVLDFNDGTCLTHGNNGRNAWKHVGKLTLLDDDDSKKN